MDVDWTIDYPEDSIRFIDAFRKKFFDYAEVRRTIHQFFESSDSAVKSVCELGSGTGSNLAEFSKFGYQCLGVDSNQESVAIATSRAKENGLEIDFEFLDFNKDVPSGPLDAILVLFVPISKRNMADLAMRCVSSLRPGGFFVSMMLAPLPEFATSDSSDHDNMELAKLDGTETVIRFNFYEKRGNRIEWDAVYLAGDETGTKLLRDHDSLDLLAKDEFLDVPSDIYKHVYREDLSKTCGPSQAPPMTFEVLDIYQRV